MKNKDEYSEDEILYIENREQFDIYNEILNYSGKWKEKRKIEGNEKYSFLVEMYKFLVETLKHEENDKLILFSAARVISDHIKDYEEIAYASDFEEYLFKSIIEIFGKILKKYKEYEERLVIEILTGIRNIDLKDKKFVSLLKVILLDHRNELNILVNALEIIWSNEEFNAIDFLLQVFESDDYQFKIYSEIIDRFTHFLVVKQDWQKIESSIIKKLESTDIKIVEKCAKFLHIYGEVKGENELITALEKNTDTNTKQTIIRALGTVGREKAWEVIYFLDKNGTKWEKEVTPEALEGIASNLDFKDVHEMNQTLKSIKPDKKTKKAKVRNLADRVNEKTKIGIITAIEEESIAIKKYFDIEQALDSEKNSCWLGLLERKQIEEGSFGIIFYWGKKGIGISAYINKLKEIWKPKYIFVVGIAGGLIQNEVSIGDIVIPEYIINTVRKSKEKGKEVSQPELQKVKPKIFDLLKDFSISKLNYKWYTREKIINFDKDQLSILSKLSNKKDKTQLKPKIFCENDFRMLCGKKLEGGKEEVNKIIVDNVPEGNRRYCKAIETEGFDVLEAVKLDDCLVAIIKAISDLPDHDYYNEFYKKFHYLAAYRAAKFLYTFLKIGPLNP